MVFALSEPVTYPLGQRKLRKSNFLVHSLQTRTWQAGAVLGPGVQY